TLDDGSLTYSGFAAAITWTPTFFTGAVTGVNITGGSGGNTFTVNNTSKLRFGTNLTPGSGSNTVVVKATKGILLLSALGTSDNVTVGAGTLANLLAGVSITNGNGATSLTVDDSADAVARTAVLTPTSVTWTGYAAPITWTADGTTKGLTLLTVLGGS